jgi:glycine/D-amino acid oxidase-like deaminating enzyme/nitrite reductase/ring-hydroxylating ferredoxin subunit
VDTLPGSPVSYWMHSAVGTPYPALKADLSVDVVVLGGGIAGVCTAWELTRAGRRVALLEAGRVAAGATGHTTAKLSSLHSMLYGALTRSFGARTARLYARSQQGAVEHVAEVVDELGIDCDLEWLPAFVYTESAEQREAMRAEADAVAGAGLQATFTTDTGLPFPVEGAVRVEGQAQFHPRKYVLALADDMTARGARVFENTRAIGLHEGDPCRVTTESGLTVTASDVVVATHYPVFNRALMFARLVPRREVVVAATIPADRDPGGMYITPEQNTRSVRTAPHGPGERLLIVTGEKFTPGTADAADAFAALAAWTADRFPGAQVAYRWATQDPATTDRVPYIGPFHPAARHVYVAAGFGGWGMSTGVLSGRLIAALVAGERPEEARLYDPRRFHPVQEARPLLGAQATVAGHFVGDRLPGRAAGSMDDVAAGTGAVVQVDGRRVGVFRDEAGQLHAVSARCTHLGCLVHFNAGERAWECPCHGSRFAVDGSVVQGPANRPLEALDLPSLRRG